ncbi:MAG: hypothetical protein Q9207_002453 [Kuettlingeria erythrocarpa]
MATSSFLGNRLLRQSDLYNERFRRIIKTLLDHLTLPKGQTVKVDLVAGMPPGFVRRAVSPLHFQPLHVEPDDILCLGSDAEEASEEHRAKRRRVEAAGQEYLRGKTLYISSARLKGPFPRNWKNPYASTKPRGEAAERAETSGNLGHQRSRDIPQRRVALVAPKPDEDEGRSRASKVPLIAPTVHCRLRSPVEHEEIIANHDPVLEVSDQDLGPALRPPAVAKASDASEGDRLLGIAKPSTHYDRGWLKTSKARTKTKPLARDRAKSPTPTPAPRPGNESRAQPEPAPRRGNDQQIPPVPRKESRAQSASVVSDSSERHTKRPRPDNKPEDKVVQTEEIPLKPLGVLNQPTPPLEPCRIVKEVDLDELDSENKEAYNEAKQLSQLAIRRAQRDWQAHLEAKKLAENAALRAMTSSPASKEGGTEAAETVHRNSRPPPCEVPPSTSLPAFEYRPRKASQSPKRTSFREDFEALKQKARAEEARKAKVEEKRRLSFTASGRVKERRPQPSLRESQPNLCDDVSPVKPTQKGVFEDSSAGTKKQSDLVTDPEDSSNRITSLPEAQIVQPPGLTTGYSTEMLETEKLSLKFPSTDEGDSYLDLSTQAAMRKAQHAFDSDAAATLPLMDGHQVRDSDAIDAARGTPLRDRYPKEAISSPRRDFLTPNVDGQEPMSTQAMMDAISPFAMTTVKKPLRERRSESAGSAARSPTPESPISHSFRAASLSMSTTPSQSPAPADNDPPIPLSTLSKPTSTITSTSMAPDETMTDVLQYDGQQQENYHMDDSDYSGALEFLGDWSVEKAAKSLQRSTAESGAG